MLNTPNYNIPYPESSDAPDGATQMAGIATAVDTAVHDHVVDGGAVDTATTAIHHTLGTGAYNAAAGNHTHGTQSLWRATQSRNSTSFLVPVTAGAYWTVGTTASSTNAATDLTKWGQDAANLTRSFTAPPSGAVLVSVGGQVGGLHGTGAYLGWVLQAGSSYTGTYSTPTTAVYTSSAHEVTGANGADSGVGAAVHSSSNPSLVTGLTPGDTYCVTMRYSNYDASYRITVSYRSILVIPQP